MNENIGYQVLIDIYECDYNLMEDMEYIKAMMIDVARILKTNIRQIAFEKFQPYGISGVLIISESHITIHTWPEYNYVGIDIFTCSKKIDYHKTIEYLLKKLKTKKYEIKEFKRGKINLPYKF